MGTQQSHRVGVGYYQLRLLDRNRACRNTHFSDSLPLPAEVAYGDQSLGGGDDHLCGDLRGAVPAHPRRADLVCVLAHPVPQPNADVDELPLPARVGRLCCLDVLDRLADFLVLGDGAGSGNAPGCGHKQGGKASLRLLLTWLERFNATLAPLRDGVPDFGRTVDTAGAFRTLSGVARLYRWHLARLAYDNFPALLRCRGDFFWVCNGHDAPCHYTGGARSQRAHHDEALGEHEQDHPGNGDDGRLRLCDGVFHCAVFRESVRSICLHQPRNGGLRLGILDDGALQRRLTTGLLVASVAEECPGNVHRFDSGQHWDVVRAIYDYRDESPPRLSPSKLGLLHTDMGGSLNLCGNDRNFPDALPPFRQVHPRHRNC